MLQFDSVIQYNVIKLSVLLKEYILTYCSLWCIQQFSSVILTTGLYVLLTVHLGND